MDINSDDMTCSFQKPWDPCVKRKDAPDSLAQRQMIRVIPSNRASHIRTLQLT
ncbi:Embryonic polarity protein dorsallike [Caligus rogercresseyi]|uniref:Embryonic polarity protein dorsallike n=1 Tax=Caligus rogercresseyi TaxID=217165 RepID=A0A7T8GTE5_CALRO|nr:Embryonic polarity protein dorsallike [Caligus rogercresseyi]